MNVNPFSYLIEKLKGYVSKSGDTVFGDLTVNAENGTANVDAYTYLKVGNQTPKSSAKHSTGLLRLCGENGKYTDIYAPNSTASRDIVFPNKSGTVALTSDLKEWELFFDGTCDNANTLETKALLKNFDSTYSEVMFLAKWQSGGAPSVSMIFPTDYIMNDNIYTFLYLNNNPAGTSYTRIKAVQTSSVAFEVTSTNVYLMILAR